MLFSGANEFKALIFVSFHDKQRNKRIIDTAHTFIRLVFILDVVILSMSGFAFMFVYTLCVHQKSLEGVSFPRALGLELQMVGC